MNSDARELGIGGLDVAFFSAHACNGVAAALRLLADGARVAVVTTGADGSIAADGSRLLRVPAPDLAPVETTGACDAFIAGFLDARVTGLRVEACLRAAADRVGLACLHKGGFAQDMMSRGLFLAPAPAPSRDDVDGRVAR